MEKEVKKSILVVVIMTIIATIAVIVALEAGLYLAKTGAMDATEEAENNHILNASVVGAWTKNIRDSTGIHYLYWEAGCCISVRRIL